MFCHYLPKTNQQYGSWQYEAGGVYTMIFHGCDTPINCTKLPIFRHCFCDIIRSCY